MTVLFYYATVISALIWISILLLPWRPWSVRESLDSNIKNNNSHNDTNLSDITVLIPARNEALHIATTLETLVQQGTGLKIIVINDQSSDSTAEIIRSFQNKISDLLLINGSSLPDGWSGKLWALQQGLQHVKTDNVLLLDADIALHQNLLVTLRQKKNTHNLQMISLMARLPMNNFWEKLLLPAFVYFFKLIYPFALNNNPHPRLRNIAAAAGGCILIDKKVLVDISAFDSLRNALIDDCSLAKKVKQQGNKVWLGLSHSLDSCRHNHTLANIWQMVARTAFTQLQYSWFLLLAVSLIMVVVYLIPVVGIIINAGDIHFLAMISMAIMIVCYIPTLRYYSLSPLWALLMPLIAVLFLTMTWTSAIAYISGGGSVWKQRVYRKSMKVTK